MREFLEVENWEDFVKIAQASNLVIRIDPYVFVYLYGLIFFIDLGKLTSEDVKNLFQALKEKLVLVKGVKVSRSIYEFIKRQSDKGDMNEGNQ
ncbi:MAG: hypothetical protein ACTSXJ_03075 [Candidatus Baldrarchaeia archaeon]